MKSRIGSLMWLFFSLGLPALAQVGGSGSTNFVPRWINSTTLGNSNIVQIGTQVGIGTSSPAARLAVAGANGTLNVSGGNAPMSLQVTGGVGAGNDSGFGTQGAGGSIKITSGTGAPLPGALAAGGTAATMLITGGSGATCFAASVRCGPTLGGNGGSVTLQPGSGGRGTSNGRAGSILLAPNGGTVGIGMASPTHSLEIRAGGTTLADAWTTRSSRRFKLNIQPLQGALEKIEHLQGVSYQRRDDGTPEIGMIAEDVDQIVPEIVSRDAETQQVDGVDYSRLAALLIEAVKSQQVEIQRLKEQVEQLTSNRLR
jgi:Chaperone of endosialidase